MSLDREEPVRRPLSMAPVSPLPPATAPEHAPVEGRTARLEPLRMEHAADLHAAGHGDPGTEEFWRFLAYGPFADAAELRAWIEPRAASTDPLFFTVVPTTLGRPAGAATFMNIHPQQGSIEIGHIWLGFPLRRTAAATEAIFLLLRTAFDLGYRRVEWKCDAANAPSRAAARRFGFGFEGIFHRHMVVKGRNRDTAWYAMLAEEWPAVRAGFEAWLAPGNFDGEGRQRRKLEEVIGGWSIGQRHNSRSTHD